MIIKIGNTYKFNTTQSDLLQHNGGNVKVVRKLTEKEADLFDVGPMYNVVSDNGAMFDVFEDELESM